MFEVSQKHGHWSHKLSADSGFAEAILVSFLPLSLGFALIGPQGLTWLPVLMLSALALVILARHGRLDAGMIRPALPFVLPLLVLFMFSVVRSAFAPNAGDAFGVIAVFYGAMATIILATSLAWRLEQRGPWYWLYFPIVLVVVSCILIALFLTLGNGRLMGFSGSRMTYDFHYNRAALFVVLLWPVCLFAIDQVRATPLRKRWLTLAAFLPCAFAVFLSESESAKLAFLIILAVDFLARINLATSMTLVVGGSVIALLSAPLLIAVLSIMLEGTPVLAYHPGTTALRLEIWLSAITEAKQAPWLGHGVDQFRSMGYFDQKIGRTVYPNHPHSFLIQTWFDLGFVGAVLVSACLVGIAWLFRHANTAVSRMYVSLMSGVIAIWAVSHGMWQPWFVGLTGCVVVFAVLVHRRSEM